MAATGGAWQSETFDNGRGVDQVHGKETPAATMGSTTPPPMYNAPPSGGKDSTAVGVAILSLRVAMVLLTLIAFSLMAAAKETFIYEDGTTEVLKFSGIKAFVGVLAMNCIVCVYAIVQLVHCVVNMSTKGSFMSSATTGFAMLTFVSDSVLVYGLMGAAAAGADSAAVLSETGYCNSPYKLCQQSQASVAMSFLAFAVLAVCAALYPVRLLKLLKAS